MNLKSTAAGGSLFLIEELSGKDENRMKESLLLQPLRVGKLTLKNRVMFPPLTTGYEERDGSIGERSLSFYSRLAKGGVGFVVIGDVSPIATFSPTPKLHDDSQIPGFKKLADALHEHDCKVALQIFHPEYDVMAVGALVMKSRQAAMEALKAKEQGDMALFAQKMQESKQFGAESGQKLHHDMQYFITEVSVEELQKIKQSIAACAKRAAAAGIDAIEVHGDRLLGSLCSTILNHRCDKYGGSFENRTRYPLEVVKAIKEAAPELMIEYKLPLVTVNGDGSLRGKGGLQEAEAIEFAKLLEQAGVDMIQAAQANHTGNMGDTIPPMGTVPYNWTLSVCEKIKKAVSVPVATVGRVLTVEAGEEILKNGQADVIGYGRSLLCDPDIANKAATGEPIRTCINCNKGCVDALQNRRYLSCVLNAENGDEASIFIKEGEGKKDIVVVGAGIAGLEAARVAAKRGYHVDVYDLAEEIGGQINLAAVPPRKSEILRATNYYKEIFPFMDITLHLGQNVSVEEMNRADAVIVAVGAQNVTLPVPGAEGKNVVSSWDVLEGNVELSGNCAVIGGGLVGTETAEYLLSKGCKVSIIEMLDKIAKGESSTVLPHIMSNFQKENVAQYVNTKVSAIEEGAVKAVNTATNEEVSIACDWVVMAVGSKKNSFSTEGVTVPVYYAGDCSDEKTADIANAIRTAYHAANQI